MEINSTTAELARRLTSRLRARHFTLLTAIYRHRMLRLVAAELNYSQPAITKALQELEALIGATLFERTRRGLVPTPVAELVVARGRTILADLDRLASDLVALDEGYSGIIRVGIIPYIPQRLLTRAVAKLRRGTQRFRFLVRDGTTDMLVGALLRHELDCVLGRFSQVDGAALEQTIVYVQQPRLLASRRQPSGKRRTLGLAALAHADWILPPRGTPTRQAFDEMLVRRRIELAPSFIETNSMALIKETLKSERLAVALLPDDVALELQRDGVGRILPLDLDFPLPAVSFIRRREPVADPSVNLFEEALRQSLLQRKAAR